MRVLALLWLLVPSLFAGEWQKFTDCRLIEGKFNDGDSFHVSANGKEFIFRLCYVDTPETPAMKKFTDRTTDQAKYFGIKKTELFKQSAEASALTKKALSQPFTVWTDGTDAKGDSALPRTFGIIETSTGNLAEILVSHGLARVYGYSPNLPDGTSTARYRATLKELEAKAFAKKTGAWAETTRKSPPKYGNSSASGSSRSSRADESSDSTESPEPETSPTSESSNYVPAI